MTESCHHPVKSGPEKLQRKAETLETEGVGEELEGGEEERRGMEGEEGGGGNLRFVTKRFALD